jgi:peptidoglycan biosynthesis protein MviN/MurJ (putative lipid II flippase)
MRGEFTPELASATADMFAALAPAMLVYSAIELLNRVFYSKNLVKFPMFAALSGIAVNFILCWIFIEILELAPVYIMLASLICQITAAAVLIIALRNKIQGIFNGKFLGNIAKIVLSSGITLIITNILYFIIKNNAFEAGLAKNILTAVIILIAGIASYLCANLVLRTGEARIMLKIIKR